MAICITKGPAHFLRQYMAVHGITFHACNNIAGESLYSLNWITTGMTACQLTRFTFDLKHLLTELAMQRPNLYLQDI